MTPEKVAVLFPNSEDNIYELFKEYRISKGGLEDAVNNRDVEKCIKMLESIQKLNKMFMLIGINRYQELIQDLEPKDLKLS